MPLPRRQMSLRNNLLDPQLGPKIKTEPNSRPSTPGLMPSYDPSEGHRGYTAPMHGWGSLPYGPSPSQAGTSNSYASDADDDDDDDSTYGYAPSRAPRRRKMSEDTMSWQGSISGSFGGSVNFGEEQDPLDVPSDMARLKGDIWPGMDIFDSATPEMRRKRNQKKATSVIVQLQATSEIVTPTELIFDNLGQFKRERVISGEPNSADDPLRGETTPEPDEPPAKKRAPRRRPRAALAEKDPNGGRNLRSNRTTGSHHPGFGKPIAQYVDGSDDLDNDDIMTYGQRPAQRRSGLSIHRDNTGPDITFDRQANMSCLTSGFPEPFPGSRPNGRGTNPNVGRPNSQLRDNGYFPQLAQQSSQYQPRAFAPGFRASDTSSQPQRDLSAFGGLTNQHVFSTSHNDFSTGQVSSSSNFPPFPQPFVSHSFSSTNPSSFVQDNSLPPQDWDVFVGLSNDGGLGPFEMNFNNTTETIGANPLFIGDNADLPNVIDDDDRTVSAPSSEPSPS
jgi:hypothetical protein